MSRALFPLLQARNMTKYLRRRLGRRAPRTPPVRSAPRRRRRGRRPRATRLFVVDGRRRSSPVHPQPPLGRRQGRGNCLELLLFILSASFLAEASAAGAPPRCRRWSRRRVPSSRRRGPPLPASSACPACRRASNWLAVTKACRSRRGFCPCPAEPDARRRLPSMSRRSAYLRARRLRHRAPPGRATQRAYRFDRP